MILVDSALQQREKEQRPVRVAMVGSGFMGRGIALQILNFVAGMDLVAIASRRLLGAVQAYREAGVEEVRVVKTLADLEATIDKHLYAVTEDASLLCRAGAIDAVIEVTGTVEYAAGVALEAIEHGKHVILMNAELDATLGPILKTYADRAGVILTNSDGDQPGVIMNLYRFVRGLGVKPVLCGNIKGLHDPYRNPTTQETFARRWGQKPHMVTSFADGSKISFEQAVVANATGMGVARRGMLGPVVENGTPIEKAVEHFPARTLDFGNGIVDYIVGASPSPGVFVIGSHQHPTQKHYLQLYKLGDGPFYCFYQPYHLCHFEIANTVARAVLFHDATIAPLGGPVVEVVAAAKIPLQPGQVLDGIGHFMTYGLCENGALVQALKLLPLGLAEGCRLLRGVNRDAVLTYDDVEIPAGRLCDRLRMEQNSRFFSSWESSPVQTNAGFVSGCVLRD